MFTELPLPDRKRWDLARLASFAAHVVVLLVLMHHSKPVFVMPSDVQLGTPGSSGTIVYLAPTGPEHKQTPAEKPKLQFNASVRPKVIPHQTAPDVYENESGVESSKLDATAQAGSIYGTRVPGAPLTGHEIIPALPQVFPDPAVSRADLPPGVQGDVVVEVTIDEQGNVVELKLIRGIGYGIEERAGDAQAVALPPCFQRRHDHRLAAHRDVSLPQLTKSLTCHPERARRGGRSRGTCIWLPLDHYLPLVTGITPRCDSHTRACRLRVYTGSYRRGTAPILKGLWGLCL